MVLPRPLEVKELLMESAPHIYYQTDCTIAAGRIYWCGWT